MRYCDFGHADKPADATATALVLYSIRGLQMCSLPPPPTHIFSNCTAGAGIRVVFLSDRRVLKEKEARERKRRGSLFHFLNQGVIGPAA